MALTTPLRPFYIELKKRILLSNLPENYAGAFKVNRLAGNNLFEESIDDLLSFHLPYVPFDNSAFGAMGALKGYFSINDQGFYIEHGLFFGKHIQAEHSFLKNPRIITMSRARSKFLTKSLGLQNFPIGPYIQYSRSLLSKGTRQKIKSRIGKTLLFFPPHSTTWYKAENKNFDAILDLKDGYDTCLACIFYQDLGNRELLANLSRMGFHVVCAGHRYNQSFLSRLKSIIELADFTCSASVGTQIPYCSILNKPHLLINESVLEEYNNFVSRGNYPFPLSMLKSQTESRLLVEEAFMVPKRREELTLEIQNIIGTDISLERNSFASH